MDGLVHDQARPRHAGLAGRREDAGNYAIGGRAEIAIVEDDLRRLASELQRHSREMLRAGVGDDLAHPVRAGE